MVMKCARESQWPCPYKSVWQVLDKDDEWHYSCWYHLSQVVDRFGGGVVEAL